MIKRFIFGLGIIVVATAIVHACNISVLPAFASTVFTIIGIFFSIGYSSALSFDYRAIENDEYALRIRGEVKKVTRSFTLALFLAAGAFCVLSFIDNNSFFIGLPVIMIKNLCGMTLLYILFYLVYNFYRLERFKYDLDDKIRKEKKN